jgi:hypothetical protein
MGWEAPALLDLVAALEAVGFEPADPGLAAVVEWTARGLPVYDATFVALADERGIPLVTDDAATRGGPGHADLSGSPSRRRGKKPAVSFVHPSGRTACATP